MPSHHYVQRTVVLGTLSLSASLSAHQSKKQSFAFAGSWSQPRDDDMAGTGQNCLEVRNLAKKTWPGKAGQQEPKNNITMWCSQFPAASPCAGAVMLALQRLPPEKSNRQSMSRNSTHFPVEFVGWNCRLAAEKWTELFRFAYAH